MNPEHDVTAIENETVYTARWVFPISRPPIGGGFIRAVGDRIVEVGPPSGPAADRSMGSRRVIDLGDVAVIPKVVNAHCHLEFSDCREPIGNRGIPLSRWIGQVVQARGITTGPQRDENIRLGVAESMDAGVGWIGDIATPPSNYPSSHDLSHPPGIVSFAEVLGLSESRSDERLRAAGEQIETLLDGSANRAAISPHAPYSTPPDLIEACVRKAIDHAMPLAMHVAESPDERELLRQGTGPFADALRDSGFWREGIFPWDSAEPITDLIRTLARAPRALLVHGNDLTDQEIDVIAGHANLTVVYCPRTHDFFGYGPHPVDRLVAAGVPVALGTDSRASNPDLSVWKEFQFLIHRRPDIDPLLALRMVTADGAKALLGAETVCGTIETDSGRISNLAVVATAAGTLDQVWSDFADNELSCKGMFGRA